MNEIKHSVQDGVVRYLDCRELTARCLGFFFDRLSDNTEEIEWLCEEMGITYEELVDIFRRLGYEEE